jgi:citrate lyase subunit beta/citryl-CoA lyase
MTPSEVLFDGVIPKSIPVCDHYCGTEVRMKKAMALQQSLGPCFDITFDLEDGAPIGQEANHAQLVSSLIASPENHFARIGVRVHDPKNEHFLNDIKTIISNVGDKVAYLVLPKIESSNQTIDLIGQINDVAGENDVDRKIPIHVLIETNLALKDVFPVAAIDQVECLSFGLMDFVSGYYGAIPSSAMAQDQFKHPLVTRAMGEISAACHTFGKTPSHNVCTNIHDESVITQDCLSAKNLYGYTRKWSIHPIQIPLIVKAFSPSEEEVNEAIQILKKAVNASWGADPTRW